MLILVCVIVAFFLGCCVTALYYEGQYVKFCNKQLAESKSMQEQLDALKQDVHVFHNYFTTELQRLMGELMRADRFKCENCSTYADDPYSVTGWIVLSKDATISLTCGRDDRGNAKTKFRGTANEERHFCTFKCLQEWIKKGK